MKNSIPYLFLWSISALWIGCSGGGSSPSTPAPQAPVVSLHPSNLTVTVGGSATFTASATGSPTPTLQWQRSADGTSWDQLSGGTGGSYTFVVQAGDHGAQFRVQATNSAGTALSQPARLTVPDPAPAFTVQPGNLVAAAQTTAMFSAAASGSPAPTIAWERSLDGISWAPIAGATGGTLSFTATLVDHRSWFRARASNPLGTVLSNAANLHIAAATMLAGGTGHSMALKPDGALGTWGDDQYGQQGNGSAFFSGPQTVPGFTAAVSVTSANDHAFAIDREGQAYVWGRGMWGQIGNDTTVDHWSPTLVPGAGKVAALAGGEGHTLALRTDRTVWSWGQNLMGQLGDALATSRKVPAKVPSLEDVVAIAAGYSSSMALKADGTVWTWGDNTYAQLGNASNADRSTPGKIESLDGVVAIAMGWRYAAALKADGTAWAWGGPEQAKPEDGPRQMLDQVKALSVGWDHVLALRTDGTVWAWGFNAYGQLGNGTSSYSAVPVQIPGFSDVVEIRAGAAHTLARKADGSLWAWGYNWNGQLGDGSRQDRATPVRVSSF